MANEAKLNMSITHKRGELSDQIINTLKDAQLFYDISNPSKGIYMGKYNGTTKQIDVIKLAGVDNSLKFVVLKEGQYDPETRVPTIEDPKSNVIYLVPKSAGSGKNIYTEWIYTPSGWEKLGDTSIDLSDYYKKNEVDTLLNAKADAATSLAGYGIVDAKIENNTVTLGSNSIKPVKSVNSINPDNNGNVNVTTFSAVPSSVDSYKTNHTTSEFCSQFLSVVHPPVGSAYLTGGICFTDMPKSFFINEAGQGGYATCELIIYVPSSGCLLLEIDTTNNFTQKWKATSSGKFRAMYDVSKSELSLPWTGSLTCPQSTELIGSDGNKEFKFIPSKDSDAVSLYWLKKFAEKNNLQMPE